MTEIETLAGLGARRAAMRAELRRITVMLEAAVRAELAAGMSEAEAARRAQVDRMTVRKWQGK